MIIDKREQVKRLKKTFYSLYLPMSLCFNEKENVDHEIKKKKQKKDENSIRKNYGQQKKKILLEMMILKSLQISSYPCSLLTRRKRRIISFKQK